jgi:para-aminobenzoate synthetase/4-amino-4-deoxychorismate lyase
MNRWHSLTAEIYALVEHTPATVLLESAKATAAADSQFSRIFTAPLRVCVANDGAELSLLFAEIESAVAAGYFAAGYFAYECGGIFEPRAAGRSAEFSVRPLAWIGIYDRCHVFDHGTGVFVDGELCGLAQFRAKDEAAHGAGDSELGINIAVTEPQYAERIAAIHEWIRSGDVYQLNFTIPIQVQSHLCSSALYSRLRSRQPAPYGAFLHTEPNRRILSFSPELFFRVEESKPAEAPARTITTRPMKGTAPRGRTASEDRALADWLRNDPKNCSENVMIVDLLRNDLGRLCKYGTVRAENLFTIERYPTLTQMTSTVIGELGAEVGFEQIFRALFPCGSITGAPKIRAMQLLGQIEQQPRGVYTGAIGFFSKERSIFNVAIRTLDFEGDSGTMGVGSGIVIDSNPAAEFRECLLKAEFVTSSWRSCEDTTQSFSLIETLLWHEGFPLIELHLDRLEDSAYYFGFRCDRGEVKAALLAYAARFDDRQTLKVRLVLDSDGNPNIEDEILSASANASPVRVRIATERTDPSDRMYFHKTTHRPVYTQALRAANQAGFDDVLFVNHRDEISEGAIHNIFVEKNGRLSTPPIECGLLAGVYRRHLLETRTNVEEKILHIEDLREADSVYLSNAVRGLRPAVIDWQRD